MPHRRNNTTATTTTHATRGAAQAPAKQRSHIVSIDTGSFANVEIVWDYHHRAGAGVLTPSPSRSNSVKVVTNKRSHVYTSYVPATLPSTSPTTKRTPFTSMKAQPASPARSHTSSSTSVSDTWSKRTYDERRRDKARDYIAIIHHHHLADERPRAHLRRQRQREREEEEARRQLAAEAEAEARRVAAAAKEARRRQRLAEQQRHEDQKRQQQQQRALREDRNRLERTRRAREIANAWNSYETRWGLLSQSQNQRRHVSGASTSLTFEQIPWPVTDSEQVITPLDGRRTTTTRRAPPPDVLLSPEAIREFLLSPAHSPEVSSKDRIRTALRRWHPDKFARVLGLVVESDRDAVADGVGIVVRCLNEMLERENHA